MSLRLRLAVALVIIGIALPARAQERVTVTTGIDASASWLRARAGIGGTMLVSPDQSGVLGFTGSGIEFEAELGGAVLPWLEFGLGILGGVFSKTHDDPSGGLLAPLGGVRFRIPSKKYVPYAEFQGGPGFTGDFRRPLLRTGLGLDVRVSRWFTVGPRIGYFNLWPLDVRNATSGARGIEMSLVLGFQPMKVHVQRTTVETRTVQVVKHESAPPPPPPPPLPDPVPDEVVLELIERALPATQQELLAPVLFRFDSAELEPTGVAMLHEVARALLERTEITLVEVRGYADQRGKSDYNDALSERRATAVQQWLVDHGVDPERLKVAGRGTAEPVESGGSEANHEQNRRVVFRVLRMEQQP